MPQLDLQSLGSGVLTLGFDVAHAPYDDDNYVDALRVLVSGDCSNAFQTVFEKSGDDLATAAPIFDEFVPVSNEWMHHDVNLNSLLNYGMAEIRFEVVSGYGNSIFLDNINLTFFTDLSDGANETVLRLYPNPADNVLIVSTPKPQPLHWYVTDMLGKQLTAPRTEWTGQWSVNTEALSAGVYILNVIDQKGSALFQRFVVQR